MRALLEQQHPDLAGLPLTEAATGWDNALWRLGDDLAVRLPHRQEAVALILQEQRWLPALAPRLPLPVPVPVRVGRPGAGYPWPWSVVPWFEGTPGDRAALADPAGAAGQLARFLRALHTEAPAGAPHNPYRDVLLAERGERLEERLAGLGDEVDGAGVRRVFEWAATAPARAGPRVWIHGDLHPANVVVRDGALAAVVDFGDLCAGDPAVDVAGAWLLLPPAVHPVFAAAYGVDPALARRATGWLALLSTLLLAIGLDGRPTYVAVGRAGLATALAVRPRAGGAPAPRGPPGCDR
ncbi:MAG TPA: aminoglycoside phosphotransferase family protein [Acidimicrobiales bacterium]|nr:aminoglycoside phosphotransferase family protein [Acidimicrobiales bacterium]